MTLEEFIKENAELIDKGEWETVYDCLDLDRKNHYHLRAELTELLLDVEPNFLEGCLRTPTYCFYNYAGLVKEYKLPDSIKTISPFTFSGSEFNKIILPENLEYIGSFAFVNSHIKSIDIPASCKNIGAHAFLTCVDLAKLNISEGVWRIGKSAFNGCINLQELYIPSSVMAIEREFISNCYNLEKVVLPKKFYDESDTILSGVDESKTKIEYY